VPEALPGAGEVFTPHLQVELDALPGPRGGALALAPPGAVCTVVLGSEGFTARCVPSSVAQAGDQAPREPNDPLPLFELAFARPALALPRLPEGSAFVLALGREAVARGRVVAVLQARQTPPQSAQER